jgi:membrane-bound inhibitor of C-type lysozyme
MRSIFLSGLAAALITTSAAANSVVYRCAMNVDILADYAPDAKSVTLYTQGQTFHLPIAVSGSGARYSDGKTTIWEHQGQAQFETTGASLSGCKIVGLRS